MVDNSAQGGRSGQISRGEVAAWFAVAPVVAWVIAFVFEFGFFIGKKIPIPLMDLTLIQTLKSAVTAYVFVCAAIAVIATFARRYKRNTPVWKLALEASVPVYGASIGGALGGGASFFAALVKAIPYGIAGGVIAVIAYKGLDLADGKKDSGPTVPMPFYGKTLRLLEGVSWLSIAVMIGVFMYGKYTGEKGDVTVLDGCGPLTEVVSRNAESFYVLAPDPVDESGVAYSVMTVETAAKHRIREVTRPEFEYRKREFYGPCPSLAQATSPAPTAPPKTESLVFGLRQNFVGFP